MMQHLFATPTIALMNAVSIRVCCVTFWIYAGIYITGSVWAQTGSSINQPTRSSQQNQSIQHLAPTTFCATGIFSAQDVQRLTQGRIAQDRPHLHKRFVSLKERFVIYYDTTGMHAPPSADANTNAVPDFVEAAAAAFDTAFIVATQELGYTPPPTDDTIALSSSGLIGQPTSPRIIRVYSVYVLNLGAEGIYGLTKPLARIGSGGTRGRWTSFIIIDNDYSPSDSTTHGSSGLRRVSYFETGEQALRAVAAHEFHHVIQLGSYGDSYLAPSGEPQCALHELTSTWIEMRTHPAIQDYTQFLPQLFNDALNATLPLSDGSCRTGYVYALFGKYLQKRLHETVIRLLWERSRDGRTGNSFAGSSSLLGALDGALRDYAQQRGALPASSVRPPQSLAEAWCEFSTWLYFTGIRAQSVPQQQRFHEASSLPMLIFHRTETFTPPTSSLTTMLRPLETQFVRFLLPAARSGRTYDTLDVQLSNNAAMTLSSMTSINDATTRIHLTLAQAELLAAQQPTQPPTQTKMHQRSGRIPGTTLALALSAEGSNPVCSSYFLNASPVALVEAEARIAPTPFRPVQDQQVSLLLDDRFNTNEELTWSVLTVHQQAIITRRQQPEFLGTGYGVQWDGLNSRGEPCASGIYLFCAEQHGKQAIGKIVLVR